MQLTKRILHLIGRDQPVRWLAVIAGAVMASVLEMTGAVLVFMMLALVADPKTELTVPGIGDVRKIFGGLDETTFIVGAAALMAVFFLSRAAVQVAFSYVKHRLAQNAGARLASKMAEGYLRLPYVTHLHRNSAELVRNAHVTVDALVIHCFLGGIHVVSDLLVVLGLIGVMVLVAPAETALAVAIVGGASFFLLKVIHPRVLQLGYSAQTMRMETLGLLQQSLEGVRDVKVVGAESFFGKAFTMRRQHLARALYLNGTASELPRHFIETTLVLLILALLGISVAAGMATERLFATLGLFAYAGLRVMPSLQRVVSGINNMRFSSAAVDQVYEDLRQVEDHESGSDDGQQLRLQQELRIRDVSFSYEQAGPPAISSFNLVVRPGEMIGICGPTGGGKTTLVDLITGLLPPCDGKVTVDSIDIAERPAAWFRNLGVVSQSVFLLDDTLRRNIALGFADSEIDEQAVEEAVRLAQLESFIDTLPLGLNTRVGERGTRLSGGQRQRVAIARALYRQPGVLILDEGTSALDNTTESVLMSSLERLRGRHTILLIAHRLSTVRNCDRIIFMKGGRMEGLGTFDELVARNADFNRLAREM